MNTLTTIKEIRNQISLWKKEGLSIGFVPTMGFLHQGHQSLIEAAAKENDKVIVSIFVNPIQFGPTEDFDKYPRNLKKDEELCLKSGANLIFAPEVNEMYPYRNLTYIDVNDLSTGLCGAKRIGHFKGVCTVVSKLFNIVTPNRAYFGQKDAQQLSIIKKMVSDLNYNIEIIGCPIIRESDGLALSSRNTYLSKEERKAALILNKSLLMAKELLINGEKNTIIIKNAITNKISSEPLANIDYIEIVDNVTLNPLDTVDKQILIAIAVFIGNTRLIDNFIF